MTICHLEKRADGVTQEQQVWHGCCTYPRRQTETKQQADRNQKLTQGAEMQNVELEIEVLEEMVVPGIILGD